MKLYHGSPKKLKILRPNQARGSSNFENQKTIFLCKTFKHAALYAIGKSLKGKAVFALTPNKLIIVGNKKPKSGYVYQVDIKAKKGPREQYSYCKQIKDFKTTKVHPRDYNKNIIRVKDINELKSIILNQRKNLKTFNNPQKHL